MKKAVTSDTSDTKQILELQQELELAKAAVLRAKADYQNLVRRNQEERALLVKLASKELVSDLLQPLDHLSRAAEQLNDKGLSLIITQFWQQLSNHGLEEINPLGQPFDVATMEVVQTNGQPDQADQSDKAKKVSQVVTKGYTLYGEVIQFARVILT